MPAPATPAPAVPKACAFCSLSEDAVKKLISGPRIYICDACVQRGTAVLELPPEQWDSIPPTQAEDATTRVWKPQPADTCRFCGQDAKGTRKIVSDGTTGICNECLGLCQDILAELPDFASTNP